MAQSEVMIPYAPERYDAPEMMERSRLFYEWADKRRSIRHFSDQPVPLEVMENIIMTASTAPSGAHKQPWTFALVSDPAVKKQIREAAEQEEYKNYNGRMSDEWLDDIAVFDTDWQKPFLETAPYLIIVLKQAYGIDSKGDKQNHYYVNESVGLAAGFLLAAVHNAGLGALTHTPSPMNFLPKVLGRPENERAFLLIPVGYPASDAQVPDIKRKPKEQVIAHY